MWAKVVLSISIVFGCVILGGSLLLIQANKQDSIEGQQRIENERQRLILKQKECESLSDGVKKKWNNVMGVTYSELWFECVVTYTDQDTGEVRTSPLSTMTTVQ
jgi:hypothetical protein